MRIVFSKDRAAQLDLLLRSLERYAPAEPTTVIYRATTLDYLAGYAGVTREHPSATLLDENALDVGFDRLLRLVLEDAGETVTFLCDDDVLYRQIDHAAEVWLATRPEVLTFSLRLGRNGLVYTDTAEHVPVWDWTRLDPHDHGYPGSIDGHTFRTADVQRMIDGQTLGDPLMLETILARRVGALAAERPLMACYREQALVGVDVNSVASSGGQRKAGRVYPQSAEDLNRRFLAGERISLDAIDTSASAGWDCLVELPFAWEKAA